jgi:hypothetical protein
VVNLYYVNLISISGMRYNQGMDTTSLPPRAREVIFQDAIRRDLTTARRAALLALLWNERFLTRAQLMVRVVHRLGRNCFGKSAWEDNFYRDLRVDKQAFSAAGFHLAFSRSKQRPGYYLLDQPALSPELDQILKSASTEVDPRQIDIYRQLSPAQRFRQGCVISDTARSVVAYRIRQQNPALSIAEATRQALQRAYAC